MKKILQKILQSFSNLLTLFNFIHFSRFLADQLTLIRRFFFFNKWSPFPCYKRSKLKPLLVTFVSLISWLLFILLFASNLPLPLFLIIKLSIQVVKVLSSLVRLDKIWKYFNLFLKCFVMLRDRILSFFSLFLNFYAVDCAP